SKIVFFNRPAKILFGSRFEENGLTNLFSEEQQEEILNLCKKIQKTGEQVVRFEKFTLPHGQKYELQTMRKRIKVTDITIS
nr:hypothetical protein [Bacteroidaceae bacterium]